MKKIPLIIDTDPGIDDAAAISIALTSDELDVKLISTCCGNVGIKKTSNNAAKLVRFFGLEDKIPVAIGIEKTLLGEQINAKSVHGDSGMDGYEFPDISDFKFHNDNSVIAMKDVLLNSEEKVVIMAIGPLTNIAVLLSLYPKVKEKIEKIVIMGGSLNRGNSSIMAEFNIDADPYAAQMVVQSGVKLIFAPLDVGFKSLVFKDDAEKIRDMNETGNMLYSLFSNYRSGSLNSTGLRIYDACAIAYILNKDLYSVENVYMEVELSGTITKGCTAFDLRGYSKKEPNVYVLTDTNTEDFRKWFIEKISNINI